LAAKFPSIAAEQELGPAAPFKTGGNVHPDQLRAEMIVHGYEPKKYSVGNWVMDTAAPAVGHVIVQGAPSITTHGAALAPSVPDIKSAIQSANAGKYGEALGTAGDVASAVLPWTPLTIGAQLMAYSPEVGDDTLKGYDQYQQDKANRFAFGQYNQAVKNARPLHHGRIPLEISSPGSAKPIDYTSESMARPPEPERFPTDPAHNSLLARKTGLN